MMVIHPEAKERAILPWNPVLEDTKGPTGSKTKRTRGAGTDSSKTGKGDGKTRQWRGTLEIEDKPEEKVHRKDEQVHEEKAYRRRVS